MEWIEQKNAENEKWICFSCVLHKKSKHGYSTFVLHVLFSHINQNESTVSFYSTKCGKIYACLQVIIIWLMNFSAVYNNYIHPFLKFGKLSHLTFDKYLKLLTKTIEKN